MSLRDFESVQRWFSKKQYEPGTERGYLHDLDVLCAFFKENPDSIVKQVHDALEYGEVFDEKVLQMAAEWSEHMSKKLNMTFPTIHPRLSCFYQLLEGNDMPVSNALIDKINEHVRKKVGIKFRKAQDITPETMKEKSSTD